VRRLPRRPRDRPGAAPRLQVLGNKHIPGSYLRASEAQRRALLAGLLDTDGTVTTTGNAQFAVTNARLAQDVQELVLSLGYRCTMTQKRVRGRSEASSTCFTLNWTTEDRLFRLERKHLAHKDRMRTHGSRTGLRWITSRPRCRPFPSAASRSTTRTTSTSRRGR
jgi:replicative DNA helicase